jgi:hypothetical protein
MENRPIYNLANIRSFVKMLFNKVLDNYGVGYPTSGAFFISRFPQHYKLETTKKTSLLEANFFVHLFYEYSVKSFKIESWIAILN